MLVKMSSVLKGSKEKDKNLRFDLQLALLITIGILIAFALGAIEHKVSSDTSSSEHPVAQTTGKILPLDVSGVLNGDYSSVVGTWKSESGASITFDTAGQVTYKTKRVRPVKVKFIMLVSWTDGWKPNFKSKAEMSSASSLFRLAQQVNMKTKPIGLMLFS